MEKLVAGGVLLVVAFGILIAAAAFKAQRPGPLVSFLRFGGYGVGLLGAALLVGSLMVVIDPGEVGVRRDFGYVDPSPLLAGVRFLAPLSADEGDTTRGEQGPARGAASDAHEGPAGGQV